MKQAMPNGAALLLSKRDLSVASLHLEDSGGCYLMKM